MVNRSGGAHGQRPGRSEEGGRERLREEAGGGAGDERVEREEEADGTGDRGSGGA